MGKTVVMGASNNPGRFSYKASELLHQFELDFVPVGMKKGAAGGKDILPIKNRPVIQDVDTVTLYMSPDHQKEYYDYIIGLKPRRIIFNPGTENPDLMTLAKDAGIEVVESCTLVMLREGKY